MSRSRRRRPPATGGGQWRRRRIGWGDLGKTLRANADHGADGFDTGGWPMRSPRQEGNGGSHEGDIARYDQVRVPVLGTFRGYEISRCSAELGVWR